MLHKAASQDQLGMTQLLLERGIDPRARDKNRSDVLEHTLAVQRRPDPEIIKLLRER